MHDHGHQVCSKLAPGLWCFQVSKCADAAFKTCYISMCRRIGWRRSQRDRNGLVSAVNPDVWTWGWGVGSVAKAQLR